MQTAVLGFAANMGVGAGRVVFHPSSIQCHPGGQNHGDWGGITTGSGARVRRRRRSIPGFRYISSPHQPQHPLHHPHQQSSSAADSYGRGAEIWPPGSEAAIRLEDSFPGGVVPHLHSPPKSEYSNGIASTAVSSTAVKLFPWITALGVAASGCLRPLDLLLVSFVTGYLILLMRLAQMTRNNNGGVPVMPALPPQGHVPRAVAHPLGYAVSHSPATEAWLRVGTMLGLVGPALLLLLLWKQSTTTSPVVVAATARPLFFLACQILTERAISQQHRVTPLPIRILVPVAYNVLRLGYQWQWAMVSCVTAAASPLLQLMAVSNLLYSVGNLFGFLLPIAVMRYMRAYFFAVEASQVVTRSGLENTL